MKMEWAVLAGAIIIAASMLFVGRYQITGTSDGGTVYRLDRWSGQIAQCGFAKFKIQDGPGLILLSCERGITNQ